MNLEDECLDKEAAGRLHYWQRGGTTFGSQLFSLIAKADAENRARLEHAFPVHYRIWQEWHDTSPEADFWEKYGLEEP